MADSLIRQPKRGILKNSSSFESVERQKELSKETKWDEMNIIATLHPKDKDYGHMKIDEPKTPYSYETPDATDSVDPNLLAEKIKLHESELPKAMIEQDESSESDPDETEDEKKKRKLFENKRKYHYNEYHLVKLARKLMEEEEEEEIEDSTERINEAEDADCQLKRKEENSDVL